jgi:hypothetical protein
MTARIAGLGAVLVVSAATVAGCGGLTSSTPHAEPKPKSAADVLLAAVPDEKSGPYHYTVTNSDAKLTGIVDATSKTLTIGTTQKVEGVPVTLDMKFLVVDTKSWTKIKFTPAGVRGLPLMPKKWMLLDPSKIKDKNNTPLTYDGEQSDPGYAHEVLINATGITQSSAGHFRGVTDLSLTGVDDIVDQATVKALGAKAKDVPFTATTDAKGRLTRLDVKIPAAGKAKAHTYSTVYDDYDTAQAPAAPAADEQQKAVPAVYDMLNG